MSAGAGNSPIQVFSTAPQSSQVEPQEYLRRVTDVARWSEAAGCTGILVYTDNSLVDPWLVSQVIIQATHALCPLVAVQPVFMHPYSVAKMVTSLGLLHGRRIFLNMVAGGFRNDLLALSDPTPHDRRYDRLVEYTLLIRSLLETTGPVSHAGEFYTVDKLRMTPPLAPELLPGIFVSGSSPAGLAAAAAIGALAVHYPEPSHAYRSPLETRAAGAGIRIGLIAREHDDEAWAVAHARFPEDRRGELTHELAMKVSDSAWHRTLSDVAHEIEGQRTPYWLLPFTTYKTFCPYLVGDYTAVAGELARYIAAGFRTFILDIPPDETELRHCQSVFDLAVAAGNPQQDRVEPSNAMR